MSGRNTDADLTFTIGQLAHYRDKIYDALQDHDGALPPDALGLVKAYMSASRRLTTLNSAHVGEMLLTAASIRRSHQPSKPGCSVSQDLYRALSGEVPA